MDELFTPNCPDCLHPMEATDDGWECVKCAVERIVSQSK